MNRRIFLKKASTVSLIPVLSPLPFPLPDASGKEAIPQWILDLTPGTDRSVERMKALQRRDKQDQHFGSVTDHNGIINAHSTAGLIRIGACALFLPNSKYYQSTELAAHMNDAAAGLLTLQNEDGTIDLLETNFHSTPDTAFLVKRMVNAYQLIEKSGTRQVDSLLRNLKAFLLKGGDALSVGGIHTPNHRWVVSGALAALHGLWPNPKYLNRIEQWLAEGVDLDPDGQYNERSTYIYSSLSDRVLISIARYADKPYLFDYVRKNLDMTRFYVHPNAEIVTDASGRQDKAIIGTLENYYYPYRYMAILDGNAEYAGMANFIRQTSGEKMAYHLDYFLTETFLWKEIPQGTPPPVSYVKSFPYSGLIRIREGNWDSSIVAQNPTWLTFMKGEAVVQGVRLASSFFGKGQFVTQKTEEINGGWKLTQHLEGPYYQPLPQNLLPGDGDWKKMPRTERPKSEIQTLDTTIIVRKSGEGVEVEVVSDGTPGVPLAIELIFREGGDLKNVRPVEGRSQSWILAEGYGQFTKGNDTITFGPGLGLHTNTTLRGALPHSGSPSVFLTGFTPFKHTITLK